MEQNNQHFSAAIYDRNAFTIAIEHDKSTILKYTGTDAQVVIPSEFDGLTVTAIEDGAFAGNSDLQAVKLPPTLQRIGAKAFYNCAALSDITIPETVTIIGDDAFGFCSVESVIIPDSVVSVGREAFARMSRLKTVLIGRGLAELGNKVFYFDNALQTITVDPENTAFCVSDGVLFSADRTTLLHYPNRRRGTAYSIPGTTRTIAQAAFAWNTELREVNIPDSIEIIGTDAFELSRLEQVTFSSSLRVIGDGAFAQCYHLQNVVFPSSLKRIGKAAFLHNLSMTKITIPDGVVYIGNCAFQLCTSVSEVMIGRNIQYIGHKAFSGMSYTPKGCHMGLRKFTVLNPTVPIDVFTFDFNPHITLYGYADNVTLKAHAGSSMPFKVLPSSTIGCCQIHAGA